MQDLGLRPFRRERLLDYCYPTESFWAEWRSSKDLLKSRGIFLTKENDTWIVAVRRSDTSPEVTPPPPSYALSDTGGLLPYQISPAGDLVARLLRYNSAVDGSDPGTGKTYTAAAVARELSYAPIVVCPMSVMEPWRRTLTKFGVTPTCIVNWEYARSKGFRFGFKSKEGYVWRGLPKNVLIIFDEAHRGKGEATLQAEMIVAARRQDIPHLLLSGTLAQNPREMRASGYSLDLHALYDFNEFCGKYGGAKNKFNRWVFADNVAAMTSISRQLYPARGVRVRIADLGDAFPETRIVAESFDVEGATVQNEKHVELMREIERLQKLKHSVKGLETKLAEAKEVGARAGLSASEEELLAEYRKAKAAVMTLDLRYRQDAELRKVPIVADLARDAIATGQSVAIFVNYHESLKLLEQSLKAVVIHGQQKPGERAEAIRRFQADEVHAIVCNIQAGGVGVSLHDVRGERARHSFVMPTYSAQDLIQVLGRVHRAGGLSKSQQTLVYAAGTVEENVCRAVKLKLAAIDALNDGDVAVTPEWRE